MIAQPSELVVKTVALVTGVQTCALPIYNNKKTLSKPVIKKPISRKERAQQKRKEMIRAFYKSSSMGSYNTEKSTSS